MKSSPKITSCDGKSYTNNRAPNVTSSWFPMLTCTNADPFVLPSFPFATCTLTDVPSTVESNNARTCLPFTSTCRLTSDLLVMRRITSSRVESLLSSSTPTQKALRPIPIPLASPATIPTRRRRGRHRRLRLARLTPGFWPLGLLPSAIDWYVSI